MVIHGTKRLLGFIFVFQLGTRGDQNTTKCRVTESESGLQKPCQFPFVWKGTKHYGCTTIDGQKGKPWCSTKVVPETLEHDISGSYYGDCNEDNTACFNLAVQGNSDVSITNLTL